MNLNSVQKIFILRLLQFFIAMIAVAGVVSQDVIYAQGTQPIVISGTVTDAETGTPLAGVNIVILDTYIGTATDLAGQYSITVPNEKASLRYTFIGYQMETILVGNQRQINVSLKPDVSVLEEVVVVGYGVQRKESVVGAISQAKGEDIQKSVQGADLGVALTGALPGLSIVRSSGRPGGRDYGSTEGADDDFAYMYIRGQNTWNNAAPLVLVDGVERELHHVNPHEIEQISVLKDASATAVFGVKGANGVILITTQRGSEGRPQLTFDGAYTGKTLSRFMSREGSYMSNLIKNYTIINELPIREAAWGYINPGQWLEYWRDKTYPEYLPDTDWKDVFTRDWASDKTINLNLSGGTKFVKYFGSLGYLNEGDILSMGDYEQGYPADFVFNRVNFRSNLDFNITPTTTFSTNLSGYYLAQRRPAGSKWTAWFGMYSTPSDIYVPQYSDGTWSNYTGYNRFQNPLMTFVTGGYQVNKETNLQTDFLLTQKLDFITPGLSLKGRASFDNRFLSQGPQNGGSTPLSKWINPKIVDEITPGMTEAEIKALEAQYTEWNIGATATTGFDWVETPVYYYNESGNNSSTFRRLYYEASINYARDFGRHSVGALGLMSRQEQATGSAFLSYREDWVGRVTYGFDRRYNFEVNAAYNGSEKFSKDYRFGFFPSYALGWTVSNESFFERLKPTFNTLRFRFSDGKIGSDAGIDRWLYVSSWVVRPYSSSTYNQNMWHFGAPYIQVGYPLRYEGVISNEQIHWETARKQDLGVETGFLDNALRINFDYFWEHRSDIFMTGSQIAIPEYFGRPAVSQNRGIVDSWGWEFELQFNKTFVNGLNIWFTHAWSYAKDKIINRADPLLLPDYQKQAGRQIGQSTVTLNQDDSPLLTWNDIYNTAWGTNNINALPGDWARVDYNSDGFIDGNDAVPWGYPTRPQYTYAPSLGLNYKNWSFYVRMYGVYNIEGGIASYMGNFAEQYSLVFPYVKERAWSPEFGNLEDASLAGLRFQSRATSGYFDRSRAYLRLQHIELAYTLKSQWTQRLGISNLRLVVGGDNLFLISDMYEDLDAPQITTESNVRRQYPTTRRYNFGVSFNFQ